LFFCANFKNFNGVNFPNSLAGFEVEEGNIPALKSTRNFIKVMISEKAFDDGTFEKTAGAKVIE